MTQERERQPIESIAREEIARDQEQARDFAFAKVKMPWPTSVTTYVPPVQPYTTQVTVKPSFITTLLGSFPFGALGLLVLIIALLLGGGGLAVLVSGGGQGPDTAAAPTPTPTPPDAPSPTPTPTPTPEDAPPATPTPTPTPEPTSDPSTDQVTFDDLPTSVQTDSGAIDQGPVADVTRINRIDVSFDQANIGALVVHDAAMPEPLNGTSRAGQFAIGRFGEAALTEAPLAMIGSPPGILAQTGQLRFQTLAIFFWELHDGVVTMGEIDPQTGQPVDTTAAPEHVESMGAFNYFIPLAEVPVGTNAVAAASFYRPTADDERRAHFVGPLPLPREWTGSEWVPVEIVLPPGPGRIDEQGNEIGPAPVDHPARLAQIDYQTDDALAYFCAILPNVEGRAREWEVSFALGDDITGFWRFADDQLTMRAQHADGRDVAGAVFPGQVTGVRVCIALPHATAAGITRFSVETLVQPLDGGPPGKHRLEQAVPPG